MLSLLAMLLRLLFVISCRMPLNSLDNFLLSIANFVLYILRTVLIVPTVELLMVGVSSSLQMVRSVTRRTTALCTMPSGWGFYFREGLVYRPHSMCCSQDLPC